MVQPFSELRATRTENLQLEMTSKRRLHQSVANAIFMKRISLLITSIRLGCALAAAAAEPLDDGFLNPPASAKPHTWWHRMNGNITREGITADLEAMQRGGIGGAQAFDVSDGIPAGPVAYMSPQWRELMKHAITEADRLGLEICMHNCGGWSSSGGPWITPEFSMQKIVFSEKRFQGPAVFNGNLPEPKANENFYGDIAVLAFPTPAGDLKGGGFRIANWAQKSGVSLKGKKIKDLPGPDTRVVPPGDIIALDKIINLTGRKTWQVPAGEWTIVRFGYTTTGVPNHPAPVGGEGLECDKFSGAAAQLAWRNTVGKVIADTGPLVGKTFNNVLIDSYEVGLQNWTPLMAEKFRQARGYNLLPYLVCVTGRVIGSLDQSERFLWDFRRTQADLYLKEYVGTFADLCHQNGMLLSCEPYGPGNFNHMEVGNLADIPMGEFWTGQPERYGWTGKLAASSANANGRNIVGAEAFTAMPDVAWTGTPANLKTEGDHFFCQGINRFIFHTYVHQPWTNVLPGMTMGPHGMQNNRNNTWFEQGAAWMKYIARCQYLLQSGRSVMDLCYVLSEDSPVGNSLAPHQPPKGYDYDVADAGTVMKMSVKDGQVVLPSGMSYRVLGLTESQRMRPALAQKIAELIKAGAVVVGQRPTRSPSLENYPACDEQVKRLGAAISEQTPAQALGKIHLAPDAQFSDAAMEYLHRKIGAVDAYFVSNQKEKTVAAEATFRVTGREPELWYPQTGRMEAAPVYHQTSDGRTVVALDLDAADSVFVVFRKPARDDAAIAFTHDGQPGRTATLHRQGDGLAVSALQAGAYVVQTAQGKTLAAQVAEVPLPLVLTGPWSVKFPAGWGAPEQIELPQLVSWTQNINPDIKHFSGTATYVKDFELPANHASKTILDLGRVEVMAEVWLNGKNLGVGWKAPYEVDVTGAVQSGGNHLEVRVVNLWINRLIGDLGLPADEAFGKMGPRGVSIDAIPNWLLHGGPKPARTRKTFITWQHFTAHSPLVESGLIGPVRLLFVQDVPLKQSWRRAISSD